MANGTLKVGEKTTSSGSGNITIGSGVPVNVNRPAFRANMSGNQTISSDTNTKIAFDTDVFDTDSAYDTSGYKFTVPTGQAGKYLFSGWMRCDGTSLNNIKCRYYVNGSVVSFTQTISSGTYTGAGQTTYPALLDLSAADYVEAYAYVQSGSSITIKAASGASTCSSWFGYKLGA